MENHFRLSTLIERIQALIHVTQSSLWMALNQLNLLKSDLELARQGNFAPTLVPIGQLKSIRKGIRAQLPRDVFLPRILTRMGWYYSLPFHLLSDNGNIYIFLDLPLDAHLCKDLVCKPNVAIMSYPTKRLHVIIIKKWHSTSLVPLKHDFHKNLQRSEARI